MCIRDSLLLVLLLLFRLLLCLLLVLLLVLLLLLFLLLFLLAISRSLERNLLGRALGSGAAAQSLSPRLYVSVLPDAAPQGRWAARRAAAAPVAVLGLLRGAQESGLEDLVPDLRAGRSALGAGSPRAPWDAGASVQVCSASWRHVGPRAAGLRHGPGLGQ
eukprot:4355479-Pyramimonas_sp.AAC.1